MKKLFTILSAAIFSVALNAQITLSQNLSDVITTTNSVACQGGDNHWARNFTMSEYGVTGDLTLESGRIGVQEIDMDETVVVNVYATTNFPTGTMTLLGSQSVIIPSTSAGSIVDYTFTTPIVIPAGTATIAVEVAQELTGVAYFIGGTAGATDDSWLWSAQCGVASYVTTSSIDFPDANFFITVTGSEETAGTIEFGSSSVSVYPNPATDIINISLKNGATVENVEIVNLAGQSVFASKSANTANVSFLPAGVYVVKVKDSKGVTHTSKIVKK